MANIRRTKEYFFRLAYQSINKKIIIMKKNSTLILEKFEISKLENPEKVNGGNLKINAQGHTVITNSTVPSTYGN